MATFTRSLDDVLGLLDAPSRKTVQITGIDPVGNDDDAPGGKITLAPFDDLARLTDTVAVVKTAAATDTERITDAGTTYVKGQIGTDNENLTDFVTVVTASSQTHTRTITDTAGVQDLDSPQQLGWAANIADNEVLKDTQTPIFTAGAGNFTQSVEDLGGLDDDPPVISRQSVLPDDAMALTDVVTPVKTAGTFFQTAIEDSVGLIDNNGSGDTSNFLFVTKLTFGGSTGSQGFENRVTLLDDLIIELNASGAVFEGPTVDEGPAGGDELFYYYGLQRGITVIQDPDTTWRMVRYPTSEELAASLRQYRGGYHYEITADEATALTNAGFGAFIIGHAPVIQTIAGDVGYVPQNVSNTYGSGGYGSGPYGG